MRTSMDMVNKINPEKEVWNLKVRLLPHLMEIILVDESVSCTTVRKTMIYRFKVLFS
ncbi:hypothetical protein AHAS_Ahas12G0100500 [Arachis hypogaea]